MLLTFLLATLFVLCDTRDDESQKLSWSRYGDYLCDFISNKSTRQRLKLCQVRRSNNGEVVRNKRDVNASLPSNFSTTPNTQDSKATYPPPTTKQRSYVGCPKDSPVDPNGYEIKGKGISINVNFTRIDNADWPWIAIVHWKRHTDKNKSECIGYRVRWFKSGAPLEDQYCDEIMNENTTTYTINASKGWKNQYKLYVVVFPLPRRSRSESYSFRSFAVPTAITTRPTNTVTRTNSSKQNETKSAITTRRNTVTTLTRTSLKQDETKSESVKKNTVSSWFVAIVVVAVLAVVIVVILMACWWIKSGSKLSVSESKIISMKETLNRKGGTDYISYYSAKESDTNTAMKIAAWLAQHEVKVIMDKFDVISNGKRIWSEQQLASAKKVILILSPGYLEICKFDQNIKKEKKLDSFMDQLAYNEICYIRDEIRKKPFAIDRVVVVLAGVGSGELPFWMKGLKSFKYSNGELDGEILKFLNDIGNNNAADNQSV